MSGDTETCFKHPHAKAPKSSFLQESEVGGNLRRHVAQPKMQGVTSEPVSFYLRKRFEEIMCLLLLHTRCDFI